MVGKGEKGMGTRVSAKTGTSIVAAVLMAASLTASAHAAVFCVKASGKISPQVAKRLGCGSNVYTTIGAAVGAASAQDTIYVLSGRYFEMVTIPSSLSGLQLIGEDPRNTVIDATGKANGFFDQAAEVNIEHFTVENAEHEGILVEGPPADCTGTPANCTPSLTVPQIGLVRIEDNWVEGNDKALDTSTTPPTCPTVGNVDAAPFFEQEDCGEGIHLDGVVDSTVEKNRVMNNAGGVLLTDETNSNRNNLVIDNEVKNNAPDCGITLASHPPNGSRANIGVASFGVYNDTVMTNLSEGNGAAGTGVFAPTPGTASYGHSILGNRLIGNTNPGVVVHSHAPEQKISHIGIYGNFIKGNGAELSVDSGSDGPASPTGIEIYADPAASAVTGVDIATNTIRNETNDVWVGAPGWSNCSVDTTPCYVVMANLNEFPSRSVGVANTGSTNDVFVDATDNFWGCAKGPAGAPACATFTGNVEGVPFLSKSPGPPYPP